jgi:hypothetical protein
LATAFDWQRVIRKPTCGKKTKASAVQAIYILGRSAHLPQEVGENQLKQRRARGTKGMVKARADPAIELLEDVMTTPRPASSEALSWLIRGVLIFSASTG